MTKCGAKFCPGVERLSAQRAGRIGDDCHIESDQMANLAIRKRASLARARSILGVGRAQE